LVAAILIISCDQDKKNLNENEKVISGYWIPKKIEWRQPDSGDKRIDSIRRYANFPLLCFSNGQFDLINATNGYTIGDDTLVFEAEPGIELFRGQWDLKDSLILVERKLKFSMTNPTGENGSLIKDTLWFTKEKSEVVFNHQYFVKTDRYDQESIDKIEAYRISDRY